jgi:hypothetical protein
VAIGLCERCRWVRRVTSGRGALFILCRRSETDPAYPRYPPLPRLQCPGYEAAPETGSASAEAATRKP